MAAMYEAVDTVQYGYERSLSAYFRNKGMSLEQGLEYVATATDAQLQEVVRAAASDSGFTSHADAVRDHMAPAISGTWDGLGVTGTGFEAEEDAFVNNMKRLKQDPANASWMNYNYQTQSGQGHVDEDDPSKH